MALLKETALERLLDARKNSRLAHAYLVTGESGSGKEWLVERIAEAILESDDTSNHPDMHHVGPESKSRRIVIDQMRTLDQSMQLKPMRGNAKVAVISEADRLQPQAANAFLKTLEEPPQGSHIFLMTAIPEAVLETILSRCITVPLRSAGRSELSTEQKAIATLVGECFSKTGAPDMAGAFRLTRGFQQTLADARTRITSEFDAELRRESAHYKQTTEGRWLDDREEQIKALSEAAAMRERERLLETVENVLASALRLRHNPSETTHAAAHAIAARDEPKAILRRIDALHIMRSRLASGVQENLALEAGFMEMILGRTGDA